ncbi:MAG: GAF domain-containing protein [Anaerolineae bacterium]|nr:GAF domain-containing protein [Anaerolineae bacterium]
MDNLLNLLSLADQFGREATSPEALLSAFLPRLLTANAGIAEATVYRLGTTAMLPWSSAGSTTAPTPKPLTGQSLYEQALDSDAPVHDGLTLILPMRVGSTIIGVLALTYEATATQNDEVAGALAQHLALHLEQALTKALFARQHIASVTLDASENVIDVAKALSSAVNLNQADLTLYVVRWNGNNIEGMHQLEYAGKPRYEPISAMSRDYLQVWHRQWQSVVDVLWHRAAEESAVDNLMRETLIPSYVDSAYILPLRFGQKILALAVFNSREAISLTSNERSILQSIGEKAAIVMRQLLWEAQQTFPQTTDADQLADQLRQMQATADYSKDVQSATTAPDIMKSTLSVLFRLLDVQYTAISLFNHNNYKLEIRAERHFAAVSVDVNEAISPDTHTVASDAWTQQSLQHVADLANKPEIAHPHRSSLSQIMAVPIQGRNGYSGVLEIGSAKETPFTNADISQLNQIANQLGIALANVASFEMSARRASMKTLANDIKSRIQRQTDIEGLMQVTVEELSRALDAKAGRIRLGVENATIMQEDA